MDIETREITPDAWPDLERLFGPNGACGGCWCMHWRLEKGESWDAVKGDVAKERFRGLVLASKAHGILAYHDGAPVAWCAFQRKTDLSRLARSPTLRSEDAADVWAIPCFYVKSGYRGRGIASALLAHAEHAIRARGGRLADGYPVNIERGVKAAPAFIWTGTLPLFLRAGYKPVAEPGKGKVPVRKEIH